MPPVYRANPIEYLPWANLTAARTADYTIEGAQAGADLRGQLDKLAFNRAMYPLELRAASLKAQVLDSDLARIRTQNTAERMAISAEKQQYEEGRKTELQRAGLEKEKLLDDYNQRMARIWANAQAKNDYTDLERELAVWANHERQDWLAESPYSQRAIYEMMDANDERNRTNWREKVQISTEKRQEAERQKRRKVEERDAARIERTIRVEQEEARKLDLTQWTGDIKVEDMGTKKSKFKTALGIKQYSSNMMKGVRNLLERKIEELQALPTDQSAQIDRLEEMRNAFGGFRRHTPRFNRGPGLNDMKTARYLSEMIGSDNEKIHKAGVTAMTEFLTELIHLGPRSAEADRAEQQEALDFQQETERREREAARLSPEARAVVTQSRVQAGLVSQQRFARAREIKAKNPWMSWNRALAQVDAENRGQGGAQ